ncbi:hypothetical protein HPB50_025220 [Hyalomma asiaticum]|uniref:Uncharacterized protein n=1 Tax=Hyalomma asiaticum TaxID=266040 RepID=A0ACB7TQZ0_HYAAI|nr:hypothetical protein HPB50_025220 [Hyalomma asiaticum]
MTSVVSTFIEDNVVKTCATNVTIPDVDFATFFSDVWQKHADKKALDDVRLEMSYTFGELLEASRHVAAGLQKFGLRQGDVVAFHCVNSCELIVAMSGTFFAGGVAAFIKTSLKEGEARCELMECKPKFIVSDIETIEKIRGACECLPSVEMLFVTSGVCEGALSLSEIKKTPISEQELTLNLRGDSPLAIPYSSGSTGLPKGVLLSHRNLISHVVAQRKPLGPGEEGEICIKGPCTFLGYLNNPKQTAEAYEDGFLRTGDTGYYSADGRIFVCSRLKELIKCMDEQVPPAEIEELLAADPEVKHVVVAGVPHPQYGEAARAFVVPRRQPEGPVEEQREAERLKKHVAAHLAHHKHLHGGVEFLESIPHTETGKDRRQDLRNSYIRKYAQGPKERASLRNPAVARTPF